jgi:hypothetical protein
MSASHASPASIPTPGTVLADAREQPGVAFSADEVSGARLLVVDVRMRSLLMHEGRQRVVTRMFGLVRDEQSLLVTMILIGAVATVIRGFAAPLWPRPSGADAAIGGSVLNATLRGLAGPPSRNVPLAGVMIACGMLSHSLRPAVAASAREIGTVLRDVRAVFGSRYGH